jgi:hypothetical protein
MGIRSLFLLCAFACGALAQTLTFNVARDYNFPPVGLSSSETAQVNLVNLAIAPIPSGATACSGTITFTNASGTTIGKPTSFATAGSQVFSTQLTFSQLGLAASDTRGEFVASVQVTTAFSPAACSLVFSLETFDTASGATHVYLGNAATGTALINSPIAVH